MGKNNALKNSRPFILTSCLLLILYRWKTIRSNMDALLFRLSKESSFYRQFRLGDLEINSWNNEDTLLGAIKRIMGFVYY